MKHRNFRWSLYALVSLAFLIGFSANFRRTAASVPRLKDRTISRLPIERNRPIGIAEVKVRGSKIHHGRGFLESNNWLEGLVIRIKNKSPKSILFASIDLQFPRPTGSVGTFAVDEVSYGNRDLISQLPSSADRVNRMAPGQTVDLRLSPSELDGIKGLLTFIGYPSASPEEVKIRIGTVIFSDDTMWRLGSSFWREPGGDPGDWIPFEEDELTARKVTRGETFAGLRPRQKYGAKYSILSVGFSSSRFDFQPLAYNLAGLACGNSYKESKIIHCAESYDCWAKTEYLNTTEGNFYLGDASAYCKHSTGTCSNVYQSVKVANQCSSVGGGGGGGGGGGIIGFYDTECYSDWDCDLGYTCNASGQCE